MILVILLLAAAGFFGIRAGMDLCRRVMYPVAYEEYIHKYAKENQLDPYLVMAVIKTESNFIPDAHSGKAEGLMQLTEETAADVARQLKIKESTIDLTDPQMNIRMGCYYLKRLIDRYDGNIDVALAAYNGGPGNVNKWLEDRTYSKDGENLHSIPFRETREYVQRVHRQWEHYREMYG